MCYNSSAVMSDEGKIAIMKLCNQWQFSMENNIHPKNSAVYLLEFGYGESIAEDIEEIRVKLGNVASPKLSPRENKSLSVQEVQYKNSPAK